VKNVYYLSADQTLFERQEKSNQSNSWASDNFSGLFKASKISSLGAYWTQDFTNVSQTLLVAFQDQSRPDMFTIGKYTSYKNISNDWVSTRYNFSVLEGTPLSMVPLSGKQDLLLYAAKPTGRLTQYRYNISSDDIQEYGSEEAHNS
jgi:hypothetical protein